MKRILTSLCLALLPFAAFAVVPHRQTMPKVDGYVLLLGDCHIHTVFSDDTSWPTTRVDEAAYDGLDFIAITDHCDTRHQKMVNNGTFNGAKVDRNTSYEIAAAAAKKYGILVVHGAELTRGNWMFPGHFNTLFIKDGNHPPHRGKDAGSERPAPKIEIPEDMKHETGKQSGYQLFSAVSDTLGGNLYGAGYVHCFAYTV